ncbi:NAD(P)/FAD-dependent oxidoreductase [Beijerinckia indica]|uniref:FAD-dependent pyridine nucleotide-disulphide oxidoreductase n=1 Tax=Beijerinckia indica subsp. indica (strain ATCC 9039 / DSM 1715 / NCIMB 8712) TaxID=395963 RepID=B2IKD9_BEII9|nr:FAD-dependent oxidoreductase [Beijerinckia indica]ACB96419.1 FAD-dependent pyridine nucleotide-disulphide oxidoreductase [Beijerinckia indica subsp. indica ATCC 9039]
MVDQSDPRQTRIVVVGAGHAGGTFVSLMREMGHEGPILVIGEETAAPYQRPPLSKDYLKGNLAEDSLFLRAPSFYEERKIIVRTGESVERIDREEKAIRLAGGDVEPYDVLVLATGSENRRLGVEGADLTNIFGLRTLAEAGLLKQVLRPESRLAVIGGGYVGLEVAASARLLGADVVVIEREPRVLARVACEPLSRFYESHHRAQGVRIETGAQVTGFEGDAGSIAGVRLADARQFACDVAIVGIGAVARDRLAREAGLACDNGVRVDLDARTSDPSIYALGDVTLRPLPLYQDRMARLESVANALEQAKQAAASILGQPRPEPVVPWFWSDQYDVKLQIAGMPFDCDDMVIRGAIDSGKFAIFHMRGDHIQAVEAVNAAPEFMGGRLLIASQQKVDRAKLADPTVSIKRVAV